MLRIGEEAFDIFYPVGSYYETSNTSFNPNTNSNWYGEWVEDTAGRVPIALDVNQSEFNQVGKIGGEKIHTLTIQEIPWHVHGFHICNTDGTGPFREVAARGNNNTGEPDWKANQYTEGAGGGQAHNNLQPYIVVKRWHRIA